MQYRRSLAPTLVVLVVVGCSPGADGTSPSTAEPRDASVDSTSDSPNAQGDVTTDKSPLEDVREDLFDGYLLDGNPDQSAKDQDTGLAGSAGAAGGAGNAGTNQDAAMDGAAGSAGDGGAGGSSQDAGNAGSAGSNQDAAIDGAAGIAGDGGAGGSNQDAAIDGAAGSAGDGGAGGSEPVSIRAVSANLTTGNHQTYDLGHGIRILQGLRPDVVMIQELSYGDNSDIAIRAFVDTTFGPTFSYYRELGTIPNGIISRFPIVQAGEWDDPLATDRDFAWAELRLPGSRSLWVISVHLKTSDADARTREANELVTQIAAVVPSGGYALLGGDFNTRSRTEGCLGAFSSRFVTTSPYPADGDGVEGTSINRNHPYDWVLATPTLDSFEVPVVIGTQSFTNGLVVDTRVFAPIEDLHPALVSDSGAANMQHMAVVRDFLVR